MISKEIEVSIVNKSLKKLSVYQGENKWADSGGIIRNDGTTMLYLIFKASTQLQILVFQTQNMKFEKSTLDKFVNNVKERLDDMSSN